MGSSLTSCVRTSSDCDNVLAAHPVLLHLTRCSPPLLANAEALRRHCAIPLIGVQGAITAALGMLGLLIRLDLSSYRELLPGSHLSRLYKNGVYAWVYLIAAR